MQLNQVLRYTVLGGVFLLPLLPFVVANSMFFPFITGKNFAFRIIVEIIFGAWVLLALRDARYRPSFSWVLAAVAVFVAVIGLADFFGANPFKSFWSNFERMEGWVTLLHLLAYFVVAGSVLTTTRLWGWLAHTSVGASTLVALYGVGQLLGQFAIHQSDVRLDATFGNATYLAMYMVFHIFITLVLMVRHRAHSSVGEWVRFLYLLPVALQLLVLYHTATRGAILGLVGGALLSALLIALFERERKTLRKVSAGVLVAMLLAVGAFFAVKDASFVQQSAVLSRFANISLDDATVSSRFTIWSMAYEGFKERPILGWGQENFNFVFNTHYRADELYDDEQWFDRVHNIIFDWLIVGGILGLTAYLLIPVAFLFHLWRRASRVHFSVAEQSIWTGLGAAYFFHNFFVFDNITSYILFFSVLAYVHALVSRPPPEGSVWGRSLSAATVRVATPFVVIAVAGTLYFANVPGIATARALIRGLSSPDPAVRVEAFERAASYDTLGRQEVAEQAVQVANLFARQNVDISVRQRMAELARQEMTQELERSPDDARLHLFLASFYGQHGRPEQAREEYEAALALSPNKQLILNQLAFNRLDGGAVGDALRLLRQAYELAPENDEAALRYAVGSLRAGEAKQAQALLDGIVNRGHIINSNLLISTYAQLGMYGELRDLLEERVGKLPEDQQARLSLAAVYLELGERDRAIAEIERVIELNPAFREQGESFIRDIEAGRNPVE